MSIMYTLGTKGRDYKIFLKYFFGKPLRCMGFHKANEDLWETFQGAWDFTKLTRSCVTP